MKIGIENLIELTVLEKDTAKAYGSGDLNVFATPAMIAAMENAALELVKPFLEIGEGTVGTLVNVKHIRPTPLGGRVNTVARLIEIDGKKLTFEVEAYDFNGLIGSGTHKRFIINEVEFMNSINSTL